MFEITIKKVLGLIVTALCAAILLILISAPMMEISVSSYGMAVNESFTFVELIREGSSSENEELFFTLVYLLPPLIIAGLFLVPFNTKVRAAIQIVVALWLIAGALLIVFSISATDLSTTTVVAGYMELTGYSKLYVFIGIAVVLTLVLYNSIPNDAPAGNRRFASTDYMMTGSTFTRSHLGSSATSARTNSRKFCPKCGAALKADVSFCSKCGSPLP